jgi:hypothetical protein
MRVTINGSGGIVTHGDSLSGGGVIEFPINEPPEFASTLANYTVTGSAPSRKLKDRGHEIAVESPSATAERAPSTGGGVTVTDGTVSVTASSIRVPLAVDEGAGVVLTSHLVIAASDPGAIGSGNFWLNPDVSGGSYGSPLPQLHVRNETDDDWYVVTAPIDGSSTGSQFIATTGADAYELAQSGTSIQMRSGDTARKIQLFSDGIEIKSDGYILISNGLPTSDPGAGHAGELFTDGVPSAGVPKALMVSGG